MSLSRLSNFLRSARGKILHVNSEDLNSTDSISNDGSSPLTPFKTLNRALLEASRYSYRIGNSNDLFNFCTIKLYSGEHYVDNRPGAVILDNGTSYLRSGSTTTIDQFDLNTNLEITSPNNRLYLLNSIEGGLIVPRGTSIVAEDLRKTIIRPLYVPDPENNNIERSAIFRVTGASFFYGFTILDANPGGFCYKNYTLTKFTPNFSHHKLTAFEYIDGVNDVSIDDSFLDISTTRTDLQQYYEKISLVYGESSGREIEDVDYSGGVSVDIQPIIDEYRIVGPRGEQIGISSITSGNGFTPSEVVTVTLDSPIDEISVDTSIQVSGVNSFGYDGQFVVSEVPSNNQVKYITPNVPLVASPTTFGATLNIISDTVQSASPYVLNCSLRSVYGMCGIHADGNKVEGFKSIVAAQFTAISLQKDNNAFVIYNETSGSYVDSTTIPDLYKNTRAKYKPSYENYHIKISNEAFAQLVSIFSIGFASQIVTESGGDYSITNSNSNFGAKTFISSGFKNNSFDQDDYGYIVGFVPPEEVNNNPLSIEFLQIDVGLTTSVAAGAASTTKLYLYNETNENIIPQYFIDGYKVGAKEEDVLQIVSPSEASSVVVMPNTTESHKKEFTVQRENNDTENTIVSGVITLTATHNFETGEKVRVISQNGHLPDGIEDKIYYTITSGVSSNQIKLASTYNNAINNISITPNKKGGVLKIVSFVSDKIPNEPGHPIQWDDDNSNWYINVRSIDNNIYSTIKNLNISTTGKSFFTRIPDKRLNENRIFKLIYSIPNNTATTARPPVNGYIIQESNSSTLSGSEFTRYFGSSQLSSDIELRNPKFISTISWNSGTVTAITELPHKFNVGDKVEIVNVSPSGYNGEYNIVSVPNSRTFTYSLSSDPGAFSNDTRTRDSNLPYVKRKETKNIYQIYKSKELQKYIQNIQDGIYELTVINCSNSPTVSPFTDYKFAQPIENLYPHQDRDNVNSNPNSTTSFAESNIIGSVVVNDPRNSITKETIDKLNSDFNVGFGITSIVSSVSGDTHTLYTSTDHNLSRITGVSVVSTGSSYVAGTYYGVGVVTTSPGVSAAFKVTIDGTSSVSSIQIMNGGSGYTVGDKLPLVTGIQTSTGFVPALLNVSSVSDDTNSCISLSGVSGDYSSYNDFYKITSITNPKQIEVSSFSALDNFSTSVISVDASATFIGKTVSISSLSYNNISGIATVSFSDYHGFKLGSKIRISGFTSSFYNEDVLITNVNSSTAVQVNYGVNDTAPATTSTSPVAVLLNTDSNLSNNRVRYYYDKIYTTFGSPLFASDADGTAVTITSASTIGLKQGDYLEVNGEIMRIKSVVTSSSVILYRAQFGTDRKDHLLNSVVRKINIIPVELRRNSIIRASGHTFEYVGYGAGNYSTSLPENQDREISDKEKFTALSTKRSGGVIYYSGMDENGDFYSANKKISSVTGEEKIYGTPIPRLFGETTSDVVLTEKGIFSDSIQVNGNSLSVFNGPVFFDNKVTINSNTEVNSISIVGDDGSSNNYGVASTIPIVLGDVGDVKFDSSPEDSGNIGWVFTEENEWRKFGPIQNSDGIYAGIWTGTFYGSFIGDLTIPQLWIVDSVGVHTDRNVGIATTSADPNYSLLCQGDVKVTGILNVAEIIEQITIDVSTQLGSPSTVNIDIANNNVHYYTLPATANWTFNFRYDSTTSLTSFMETGQTITVALLTTQGSPAYYNNAVTIGGQSITVYDYGDFTITEGNPNSIDMYTFVLIKKANTGVIANDFTVLRSFSQYKQ